MSTDVDTLSPPAMASWLRETAANTRKHSDPAWCAARAIPYDPVAGHVAFRMEQAANLLEKLHGTIRGVSSCAQLQACPACRELLNEAAHDA